MLVHIEARLAFLAMTKCGSTSVENALKPHCHLVFSGHHKVTHMHIQRYKRFVEPYLKVIGVEDVETTCLFRNPIDWLESWWRYRSQPGRWGAELDTSEVSFEQFACEYLDEADRAYVKVGRQTGLISGPRQPVLVDHLFRFEEMDRFQAFWQERLGFEIELPHHNKSPERPPELSTTTRSRLEAFLSQDFDIWENRTVGHRTAAARAAGSARVPGVKPGGDRAGGANADGTRAAGGKAAADRAARRAMRQR